jgi:hypothetical protein
MASKLIPTAQRVRPWKSEGEGFVWTADQEVTPRQAMEVAGLDTPVTKHPIYSHTGQPIPRKAETWRDGKHLAVVGQDTYAIKQFSEEALPLAEQITYESDLFVTTAVKYAGGARELMVLEWPEQVEVGGQPFDGFLWIANSHDGSSMLTLSLRKYRFFCTNQVPSVNKMADLKVPHRNGGITAEDARKIIDVSLKYDRVFAQTMEEQLSTPFDVKRYEKFVNVVAPLKESNGTRKTGRGLTMAMNAQDSLWASYRADDLNGVRDTLFGAWQAAIAYYDWAYSSDKSRGLRALTGSTDANKQKSLSVLSALV